MKKSNTLYLRFLLMKIFMSTSLILPIRILYMIQYNISDSQITVIKAIFSFIIVIFEVPTGIISDKVSKKLSLRIGSMLFAIHSIFYILMPNFISFLLTQICLGLASTFISGSDVGYLHDYISDNTNDDFLKIYGKITLYSKFFSVLYSLTSAILFSINNKLNFIISFILGLLAFLIISTLPEQSHHLKQEKQSITAMLKEYSSQIFDVVKYTLHNKWLLNITLLTSINYAFLIFNFEYYQIILSEYGFKTELYGFLYALFMLLMGYGARLSSWISKKLKTTRLFRLYIGLIGISYILIGIHKGIVFVLIGITIQQLCYGSWGLIVDNIILEAAPTSNVKSTLISLNSLLINFIQGIIIFIMGITLTKIPYTLMYIFMGFIMWSIVFLAILKSYILNLKKGDINI